MAMNPRLLRPRATTAAAPPSGTPASFLLRFDGNFNDSSPNALATSATGATLSSTTKKWGSGSAYFATAGQEWVEFLGDPPLLGSQDFTMECWLYLEALGPGGASHIMGRHQACTGASPMMAIQNSTGVLYWEGGTPMFGVNPIPTGQWTHLAVVRSGETLSGYMNGMLEASVLLAGSLNDFEYPFRIGGTDGCGEEGSGIQGYIDDARLVVGLAVYTTNFTPPAAPLTVIATPYVPPPAPPATAPSLWKSETLRPSYHWST